MKATWRKYALVISILAVTSGCSSYKETQKQPGEQSMKKTSYKEIKGLIDMPGVLRDPELDSLWMATGSTPKEYYLLPDGRVCFINRVLEYGAIYPDRKAAIESLNSILKEVSQGPRHILSGIFDYDQSFPQSISRLISDLQQWVGLDLSLDYSLESVYVLDDKLRSLYKGAPPDSMFAPIVAYAGEVIRRNREGEWRMKYIEDANVWEPEVVIPRKKSIPIFLPIAKDFREGKSVALYAYVYAGLMDN